MSWPCLPPKKRHVNGQLDKWFPLLRRCAARNSRGVSALPMLGGREYAMTGEVLPFVQRSAGETPTVDDLKDFFENGAIGLHLVGPDGTILRANKAELSMMGYEAADYVG